MVPRSSWKRDTVAGATACSVIVSCDPGASVSTESSRSVTCSFESVRGRSWSPRRTGSPAASGLQAPAPGWSTSAAPSSPVTVPTRSCARATTAPAASSQSAARITARRCRGALRSGSEYNADLCRYDVASVLVDRDVRVVEGTIVRQSRAQVRGDRAPDADRELVDRVLARRAEGRLAGRIVLVAEEVGEVDRRAPARREAEADPNLMIPLAEGFPEYGMRLRPLRAELVADRDVARSPVHGLVQARSVGRTVTHVLERLAQIGHVSMFVHELGEPPVLLGPGDERRHEGRS